VLHRLVAETVGCKTLPFVNSVGPIDGELTLDALCYLVNVVLKVRDNPNASNIDQVIQLVVILVLFSDFLA
jgi:hypothetical protein